MVVVKFQEAIKFFKRNISNHPKSINSYDSIAEAYERSAQIELAIKNNQKVLNLDVDNKRAKMKISKLRKN